MAKVAAVTAQSIIEFWFNETSPQDRWQKNAHFDRQMRERFLPVHQAACRCELDGWRSTALGRLAEIVVLDQFSRNMFRDRPEAFAQDALALCLAQEAIAAGVATALTPEQKVFLYMPYMHSESLLIHQRALRLFAEPGLEQNFDFERRHQAIIERFGRYPHRNAILGRESTAAELDFLAQPGSSF